MEQGKIDRINVLAKKQKTVGLTDAETKEQKTLRQDYIRAFRKNLIDTLDHVSVQEADGSVTQMKTVRIDKDIQA